MSLKFDMLGHISLKSEIQTTVETKFILFLSFVYDVVAKVENCYIF